jgi:hypothetical protein
VSSGQRWGIVSTSVSLKWTSMSKEMLGRRIGNDSEQF